MQLTPHDGQPEQNSADDSTPNSTQDSTRSAGSADDLALLRQEIASLQSAVLARDEFISMIVHEVRNPLTPLLMQASALALLVSKEPAIPERIVRGVRSLDAIVEHLMRRTSALLDISRMSSGIYRLEPIRVDLSSLLDGVVSRMAVEALATGSTLYSNVAAGIVGRWDPLALEQVADNLISNAIKYGNGRPIHIDLVQQGAMVVLTVRDEGMGISAEDLSRVFDRFERAVRRGQASGFGIGLWLVGRLTQAMGGTIDVDSSPGQGTTITVTFPFTADDGIS